MEASIQGTRSPEHPSLHAIRQRLRTWQASGRTQVHEADSKSILAQAGLPIPASGPQPTSVVKYCCDDAMHKSDLGLVQLRVGAADVETTSKALRQRASAAGLGNGVILVEEMVTDGLLEWFVGCRNDSTFGPIVVLGIGGIYAELFGSPEIRLAPLTAQEAEAAIRAHRGFAVIDGARGKPKGDVARFATVVARIAQLYWNTHDLIGELDLNPIIVRPADAMASVVIVDASIVLR